MSKHSKTYEDKKAELAEIEKELRDVIDNESKGMEKSVVGILKIAAIASTAVLVGYGVYRWTSGENDDEKDEGDKPEKGNKFFEKVVDKVTEVVTGLVVQNVTGYLDKLKEEVEPKR